jgi:hypothetical protein
MRYFTRHLERLVVCSLMLFTIAEIRGSQVQPALASCVSAQPIARVLARAPIVFVGTVLATSNNSRTATVLVDDVWRGTHVPQTVVVRGSPVAGNGATSVDRSFVKGLRYLFVPESTTGFSPFQDNICTATRRYTAALARYRPRGAHHP